MTEHFQGPGYGITATNGSSQVPLSTVGLASILSERGWQARFDGEGDLIWDSPFGPCFLAPSPPWRWPCCFLPPPLPP